MKLREAGALLAFLAVPTLLHAQAAADHVGALGKSLHDVALHAHELIHAPASMSKVAAQKHSAAIGKSLDASDQHLAEVEKAGTGSKLVIAELKRDQASARTHLKALDAELAKAKPDHALLKKHAEGIDGAVDDAAELQKKLLPKKG